MTTRRKIIIQHLDKKKEFDIPDQRYNELISLIEYYGYEYCPRDNFFVYSNDVIFDIVDLNLSYVSTPQPAVNALIA